MKLKIEYVPTSELKMYANNAKIHTKEQLEQIKRNIREFGFNDPIAVWKDNEIIEGHGRFIAATELELPEVPVIRLDDLTDEQRRAYMLVHNKLTMNTDFDMPILDMELDKIIDIDMEQFDFSVTDIDWAEIEDLSEETYEEPTARTLRCPKCSYIGPKSLFVDVTSE